MLRATLRLTAIFGTTMISSSSSSLSSSKALRSPIFFSSSSSRLFNGALPANRVCFSPRFAHASLRCYASSLGFDRIQVQNPIVEMDGLFANNLVLCCLLLCFLFVEILCYVPELGDEMTRIIWRMIKDKVWASFRFQFCVFLHWNSIEASWFDLTVIFLFFF